MADCTRGAQDKTWPGSATAEEQLEARCTSASYIVVLSHMSCSTLTLWEDKDLHIVYWYPPDFTTSLVCESVWCEHVLSCAVLCCAVLCCAVLCCAVLCCAVLCCAVLCCAVLCCAVLTASHVCDCTDTDGNSNTSPACDGSYACQQVS